MGVAKDVVADILETMQRAKSPARTRRILPKRWRQTKPSRQGSKADVPVWRSQENHTWVCPSGRRVTLSPASLLTITELERLTLQKVALAKLQAMELGCSVTIPKEWSGKRSKKSAFSSLRKRTASTSLLENLKDRSKDKDFSGSTVFGIPLAKCVANDAELRRRKPSLLRERRESLDMAPQTTNRHARKSSSSSGGAVSCDSLSESDGRSQGSNLLDALSLSSSSRLEQSAHPAAARSALLAPHLPRVPFIVNSCCKHLETYGLRTLGIFRIGSSKKRTRQLREEFDSAKDVKLNEDHNPHDVGALLKEFFRDLPDPLLTRDLYTAFVATRKLGGEERRQEALQYLVALLPAVNRDTLWNLLRFLHCVAQHAGDSIDHNGQTLSGNKMDSHNLATLFGPNLLHKSKVGGDFHVETQERAEERQEVIAVLKHLIERHAAIFKLSPDLQDEVLQKLQVSEPESLDALLKLRSANQRIEVDPETSASSVYEESECSSAPHSPGLVGEADPGAHPATLTQALRMSAFSGTYEDSHGSTVAPPSGSGRHYHASPLASDRHKGAMRARSADVAPSSGTSLKVPVGGRMSAPEQGRVPSSRSISPAASPRPAARDSRPGVTPPWPGGGGGGAGEAPGEQRVPAIHLPKSPRNDRRSPLPARLTRRSAGVPHGPGPGGGGSGASRLAAPDGAPSPRRAGLSPTPTKHTLAVPPPAVRTKSTESASSASSGGYYGGSSRSATSSPVNHEGTPSAGSGTTKWYIDTPPESPKEDSTSQHFHRSSSTHRPLGFHHVSSGPDVSGSGLPGSPGRAGLGAPRSAAASSSPSLSRYSSSGAPSSPRQPEWQQRRWQEWEQLAREHSDEFHEQETLV